MNNLVHKDSLLKLREADLTTVEGTQVLCDVLLKVPQADCAVVHHFSPGLYFREAHFPTDTLIVGQEHISDHTNFLISGSIGVINQTGIHKLDAPFLFVSPPGSKVGRTYTPVIWQNIYATEERDLEKLQDLLYAKSDVWEKHLDIEYNTQYKEHEQDRIDYKEMVLESGYTEEEIDRFSHLRLDCIPFPYGSYIVQPGKSPIQGTGLFCTAPIPAYGMILPMRLNNKRTPAGYLVNHSNTPNCVASLTPNGDMYLTNHTNLKGMSGGSPEDELTLDYKETMRMTGIWKGV